MRLAVLHKRLSGLTIGITRRNGDDSILVPLIEEKHLPSSVNPEAIKSKQHLTPFEKPSFGFKLNDRLFKDILAHNVPIPLKLLQKTRKQSQMQDLLIFLYWRSYAAQSESIIPWPILEGQLAHDDSNKSRINLPCAHGGSPLSRLRIVCAFFLTLPQFSVLTC